MNKTVAARELVRLAKEVWEQSPSKIEALTEHAVRVLSGEVSPRESFPPHYPNGMSKVQARSFLKEFAGYSDRQMRAIEYHLGYMQNRGAI